MTATATCTHGIPGQSRTMPFGTVRERAETEDASRLEPNPEKTCHNDLGSHVLSSDAPSTSMRTETMTTNQTTTRTIETTWDMATYDVWGNADNGYDVNDVYRQGSIDLTLTVETHNTGTMDEFESASPSDDQLCDVFGFTGKIETDGDDLFISVNRAKDGYPIGELRCTSHESLSPIRATQA